MKVYKKILLLILFGFLHQTQVYSQGFLEKNKGHFTAPLVFYDFSSEAKYKNQKGAIYSDKSGWPGFGQVAYSERNIKVWNIASAAVLVMDWWTLFSEPVELYNFQWLSSGRYQISVNGREKTINRTDLEKYPDLLKRFDAIKPLDLHFEIQWTFSFPTGNRNQVAKVPQKWVNSFPPIFTTKVSSEGLLFAESGKEPLSVPGIRLDWKETFFSSIVPNTTYFDEEIKEFVHVFENVNQIEIKGFSITNIKWPVNELKEIAEIFEDYKSGKKEPLPSEVIAKAEKNIQNMNSYKKEDFWSQPFEETKVKISVINEDNQYFLQIGESKIKDINAYQYYEIFLRNELDQLRSGLINIKEYKLVVFAAEKINNSNRPEFRIYDYDGKVKFSASSKFKENDDFYSVFKYSYLIGTPFIIVSEDKSSNQYRFGGQLHNTFLVDLRTLKKIEISSCSEDYFDNQIDIISEGLVNGSLRLRAYTTPSDDTNSPYQDYIRGLNRQYKYYIALRPRYQFKDPICTYGITFDNELKFISRQVFKP